MKMIMMTVISRGASLYVVRTRTPGKVRTFCSELPVLYYNYVLCTRTYFVHNENYVLYMQYLHDV